MVKAGESEPEGVPTGSWVFLTNHAHVLLCIARDPQARTRDIAEQVGITERATQRILADLRTEGYVARTKVGRRNRYTINGRGHLRHPIFRNLAIGPLLEVLNTADPPTPARPRNTSARLRPSTPKRRRA
jgi:hypothetical protein